MAITPLRDKIVAKKEEPLTKTKSGILLGEAKETPAYKMAVKKIISEDVEDALIYHIDIKK